MISFWCRCQAGAWRGWGSQHGGAETRRFLGRPEGRHYVHVIAPSAVCARRVVVLAFRPACASVVLAVS